MDGARLGALAEVRGISDQLVSPVYLALVPANLRNGLPPTFWSSLSEKQRILGLRLCLLLWTASGCNILPREFQLQATIALLSGLDVLVDIGTGYGKTICMILACLLYPLEISMIISPLKRLQALQVLEFEQYGIKTLAINEDTPNNPELWKDISAGKYTALIVQPEQLSWIDGHLPRLAKLLTRNRQFAQLVRRLHVDEAHFIATAGQQLYGIPAFRPAWGLLGDLRIKLGRQVVVQALSGTQPSHIKQIIVESLLFDKAALCSIKLSSNRPNIIYATHPIVGRISDFRNLDFLIPKPYPEDYQFPKTLVFHDSIDEATAAAEYLRRQLPESDRNKGIIKHYHSRMSKRYLTEIFEDFSKPDGSCRVLHATEGASTGVDVSDIEVVIQYGITRDVPTTLQRGGRCGREGSAPAIFLIMYEPWVLDIDLSTLDVISIDPDYPNGGKLDKYSTKMSRTGIAMIKAIQCRDPNNCLRMFWAEYLGDKTPQAFTAGFCCDRHPGDGFNLRRFFKGRFLYYDVQTQVIYYGDRDDLTKRHFIDVSRPEKRKASVPIRPKDDRESLISHLLVWRHHAHDQDELGDVRPASFILTDKAIQKLARPLPGEITDVHIITKMLGQSKEWQDEWARKIVDFIHQFDKRLASLRRIEVAVAQTRQKKAKFDQDMESFEAATKATEERVAKEVSERVDTESREPLSSCENNPPRRSTRHK